MLTSIKSAVFGRQPKPRRIPIGLYNGLHMKLDLTSQLQLFVGLAERETHPWIRAFGRSARYAIDIGAGDGELVLYLLKRTAVGRIYAFEPSELSLVKFRENLELNGYGRDGRVRLSQKFVGSRDDDQFCTLDSLLSELDGPCFIKIDVDGSEVDILSGAAKLLRSSRDYWLVETHSAELETKCLEMFSQSKHKTHVIRNGWYRAVAPEMRPIPHNRWLFAEPDRDATEAK